MSNAPTVRLFKADTPHDVASACLVAGVAPARDYLAISLDKSRSASPDYLPVMRALARAHPWCDVIEIPELPMMVQWMKADFTRSRFARYGEMRASFETLRTTISDSISPATVDELFLSCLRHPDTQLLVQVAPSAKLSYLPHGLGSIHDIENRSCIEWTHRPPLVRRVRHLLTKGVKGMVWGPAATPPLFLDVAAAYSFYRYPAIGRARYDLSYLMTPSIMRGLFETLPHQVQSEFSSASAGESDGGLLLLAPSDLIGQPYDRDLELEGLKALAVHLIETHGVRQLIIKPHPRSGSNWIREVTAQIQSGISTVPVSVLAKYSSVPIEVAAAGMHITAAASLASTAVHTLPQIYDIPMYTSEPLLRQLYSCMAGRDLSDRLERWMEDNRSSYRSIAISAGEHASGMTSGPDGLQTL